MREYKFRGFNVCFGKWVYGALVGDKIYSQIKTKNYVPYKVDPDSVGLSLDGELYEGDIFVVPDEYPFFDDQGNNNYVGVLEYVPDDGYCGWYYELVAVSGRVRGGACGSGMADLEGKVIEVVGNKHENGDMLKCDESVDLRLM